MFEELRDDWEMELIKAIEIVEAMERGEVKAIECSEEEEAELLERAMQMV